MDGFEAADRYKSCVTMPTSILYEMLTAAKLLRNGSGRDAGGRRGHRDDRDHGRDVTRHVVIRTWGKFIATVARNVLDVPLLDDVSVGLGMAVTE